MVELDEVTSWDLESGKARDIATRIALAARAAMGSGVGREPNVVAFGSLRGALIVDGVAFRYELGSPTGREREGGKGYAVFFPLRVYDLSGRLLFTVEVPVDMIPELKEEYKEEIERILRRR